MTKCSARGGIFKINGANVNWEEIYIEFVKSCDHNGHIGLSDADLVAADFCRSLKARVTIEPDKSVQQIL